MGRPIKILGTNLTGATSVSFNGTAAVFRAISNSFITATVPAGATTGTLQVVTPGGTLASNVPFRVKPEIISFSPSSGRVGTQVVITGTSFTETTKVGFGAGFGAVFTTQYTADSDTQVTATVPAGAPTGKIVIDSPGGVGEGSTVFTVTP